MPKSKKSDKTPDLAGIEGPGVGAVKIPELDTLIDKYVIARDKRMQESPKEKNAKTNVIDFMLAHQGEIGVDSNGEILYRHGDEVLILKPGTPKLSIREAPEVT